MRCIRRFASALQTSGSLIGLRGETRSKEVGMPRFRTTTEVMEALRERNRLLGKGNKRIDEWVEVTLLTQWCVSKELEVRYQAQEGCFMPTKQEQVLFGTAMPWLANLLESHGFRRTWWFTFNRNCLESGRINADLETEYKRLIIGLAEPL